MGSSYSIVREEQEEEEFKRLVEAVEIAQQRSARQDDVELGLRSSQPLQGGPPTRPVATHGMCLSLIEGLLLTCTLT